MRMQEDITQVLDLAEAEKFIGALTGSTDAPVTFQTFPDDKSQDDPSLSRVIHGTLQDAWPQLAELNLRGAAVCMMINEGDGAGRREENVTALRALFVDDDHHHLSTSLPGPPTVVVQSKNGLHCYWRLRPGEPLEAFEPAQAALAAKLGTDPSVRDLARVMRLPGTLHMKDRSNPYLVGVNSISNSMFSTTGILAVIGTNVTPVPAAGSQSTTSGRRTIVPVGPGAVHRAREYLKTIEPAVEGERGDTRTYRAAAALVNDFALTDDQALDLLRGWNKGCSPPWTEDQLVEKIQNARAYGKHATGAKLDESAVAGFSDEVQEKEEGGAKQRKAQAALIVELAVESGLNFFHDLEGEPYASAPSGETWPLSSASFKRWLAGRLYREGTVPRDAALKDALGVMAAMAVYDGPELPIFVRMARMGEAVYLDLGDPAWRVVEVTGQGWQIIPGAKAPVRFRRPPSLLALPEPDRRGRLADLRQHLNLADDRAWALVAGYVIATMALAPRGPFPILAFRGEQGSAKTTACSNVAAVIDPRTSGLRALPKGLEDLAVAAHNGFLIALDNVSHIDHWLSDALCRLATGGGFATRQFYTNREEATFGAARPVLLNGIENSVVRGDLADRTVVVELPRIDERRRLSHREAVARFEAARPRILGGLLDAVALALRNRDAVHLEAKPRMADFAEAAVAAEAAMEVPAGTFLAAYGAARTEGAETAANSDVVAEALITFMATRIEWKGSAGDLLAALVKPEGVVRSWPTSATAMGSRLTRLAPSLRALGLGVEQLPRSSRGRCWGLTRGGHVGSRDDTSGLLPEVSQEKPNDSDDLDGMTPVTPLPGPHPKAWEDQVVAHLVAGPAMVITIAEALGETVGRVERTLDGLRDRGVVNHLEQGSPPQRHWRLSGGDR